MTAITALFIRNIKQCDENNCSRTEQIKMIQVLTLNAIMRQSALGDGAEGGGARRDADSISYFSGGEYFWRGRLWAHRRWALSRFWKKMMSCFCPGWGECCVCTSLSVARRTDASASFFFAAAQGRRKADDRREKEKRRRPNPTITRLQQVVVHPRWKIQANEILLAMN